VSRAWRNKRVASSMSWRSTASSPTKKYAWQLWFRCVFGLPLLAASITPIVPFTGVGVGLEYSPALRPERLPVVPKGIWSNPQVMDRGFHLSEGPDAQAELSSLVCCGARFCRAGRRGCPKCRNRRGAPIPASVSRRGCPTATASENGAAARIPATHRIGRQRVKPAARHTTISDPPAVLGTWSTAVDRKRTLEASDCARAAVLLTRRVCRAVVIYLKALTARPRSKAPTTGPAGGQLGGPQLHLLTGCRGGLCRALATAPRGLGRFDRREDWRRASSAEVR
jgi:hypothetical protein